MSLLPGEPEPRLTVFEAGPMPVLEAGMPRRPRWPRLTSLTAGRFEGAMGLSGRPSATGEGCGELLGTEAACARPRCTTLGAGGGETRLGGAGMTGAGRCTWTSGTLGMGLGVSGSGTFCGVGLTSGGLGVGLMTGGLGRGLGLLIGSGSIRVMVLVGSTTVL